MSVKNSKKKIKVLIVFGTRPEVIKSAPVVAALNKDKRFNCRVCLTGQHRTMAQKLVDFFGIKVHHNLKVMKKNQTLDYLTIAISKKIGVVLDLEKPDLVLVQGDTSSVFLVALASFYRQIKVGHIEAGLRTYDKLYPFPEEMNRRLVSEIADFHFAPTDQAVQNLVAERIPRKSIFKTGNTSVDALLIASKIIKKEYAIFKRVDFSKRIILVTAHRRESLGKPLEQIFLAVKDIVKQNADVIVVYPVHLNPKVKNVADRILGNDKRVHLLRPLDYEEQIFMMKGAFLILTDSGGIQEEAPYLRKPLLVMRDETERPEGVRAGVSKLVGRKKERIVREANKLLNSPLAYKKMTVKKNPYGDGKAAAKIISAIKNNR